MNVDRPGPWARAPSRPRDQLFSLERDAILPVKWGLLGLCITLAIFTSPGYLPGIELYFVLTFFLCANVLFTYALLRIPEIRPHIQIYSISSYAADILTVCALIYVTGGITSDFYILFFLVVFRGAGIFPTVRSTLMADIAATLVYGITLFAARDSMDEMVARDYLVRFGLLWCAMLLGWLMVHIMTRQKDDYLIAIRELQVQNEFVNNLLQSMSEGFIATDPQGRVTILNQAARRILRLDAERDYVGDDIYALAMPLARVIEQARRRQDSASEVTIRLGEDDARAVELLVSARGMLTPGMPSSKDNTAPGVVCVFRDMSLVRQLEAGLIRSEKLASVGELAAGLAHELGNPLSIIKSCGDYLCQTLRDNEDVREELEIIGSEVDRCKAIVDQLLTLARPPDEERTVLDLCAILRSTCELIRLQKGGDRVKVVDELGPEPIMVSATGSELTSVFTNILVNAVQANAGEGKIILRATFQDADSHRPTVVIEIADTGCGMPPETLEHIFEPFFTRREGGTGLGLSIVARILDHLGANVDVKSQPDVGTTFRLTFPLARRRRTQAS